MTISDFTTFITIYALFRPLSDGQLEEDLGQQILARYPLIILE